MKKAFCVVPSIIEYDTFKEFLEDFELKAADMIITNRHYISNYMQDFDPVPGITYLEDFGHGEPSDEYVDKVLSYLDNISFDRIIAIGGGSTLDISKLISVADKGDTVEDIYLRGQNLRSNHRLYAIPTTCGTGSEVTNIAVAYRLSIETKQGLSADAMYAEQAVFISEFMKDIPYKVFATASIDAFVHACESYLSPNYSCLSESFSKTAMHDIIDGWKVVTEKGFEKAWNSERMLSFAMASCKAGLAFGYAGTGPVHGMNYPFANAYHIPHGQANYMMFEAVIKEYRLKNPDGRIQKLAQFLSETLTCPVGIAFEELFALIERVFKRTPLSAFGITPENFNAYVENVIATQQRNLRNAYIPLTKEDMLEIYQFAL